MGFQQTPRNLCLNQNTEAALLTPVVRLLIDIGLTNEIMIRAIVPMKIIADTNTFIAVALNEPEKFKIIELTEGHDLIAPDVLPFEIGNALTAMMKNNALKKEEVVSAWEIVQQIPVDLRHTKIKSALSITIKHNLYAYDAYF
jgi:predicted nucleic acid-binding protein